MEPRSAPICASNLLIFFSRPVMVFSANAMSPLNSIFLALQLSWVLAHSSSACILCLVKSPKRSFNMLMMSSEWNLKSGSCGFTMESSCKKALAFDPQAGAWSSTVMASASAEFCLKIFFTARSEDEGVLESLTALMAPLSDKIALVRSALLASYSACSFRHLASVSAKSLWSCSLPTLCSSNCVFVVAFVVVSSSMAAEYSSMVS
mmetsp:Transcript_77817/g.195702  ORF Transcript_77817/g.195702 Transcript_77817/m.195702 type:complete len:206 (+) Transcript_77817:521-1138(+)